jgi:hypothetical protein
MQIKYRTSLEDYVTVDGLRFQHEPALKKTKWFFRILCFLFFQCMLSTFILIFTDSDNVNIPKIFLVCNVIFVVLLLFCSRRIRRFYITSNCKEVDFNSDRTIEIQERNLIWERDEHKIFFSWDYFKSIERLDEYILLKFKAGVPIAVLEEAFGSPQEADEFIRLARAYKQNAEAACKSDSITTDNPKSHRRPIRKKTLIVLITCVVFICLFNIWATSGGKHIFWSHVFNEGDPQALYQETTNGFKSRISQEQWERLVEDWREKLGTWQKTKILSFVPYDGDEFPDKLTESSDHFNSVQKMECKVVGSNGVAYITSYRYHLHGSGTKYVWRENSFEIIFEVANLESYLLEEDVKFVEEEEK